MESSRRAVEGYWRGKTIEGATSDDDKVTPVYKLDEISELIRSSHVTVVHELSSFLLKRLDHKSPLVKLKFSSQEARSPVVNQKVLRLIKYVVPKSGVEFRREMQRHSVAIRQLTHYKGQLDPLKGDSLNKAVRDMATETVAVIFSSDDNKPPPSDDLNRRIQGFGNTNFEMGKMAPDVPKSFLSEVVDIGSATIKQGLSSLTQNPSMKKNDIGSYKSPNLRKSLTTENETDRYARTEYRSEAQKSAGTGPWGNNSSEETNAGSSSNFAENKTREERLLETIVTSGGVRLQPTREALQAFLVEAKKLDALALSQALESKLISPMWQVRMKAICVLEAILRKKDVEQFFIMESYFIENNEVIVKCTESPQASLRERSMKVLNLLLGDQNSINGTSHLEKPTNAQKATTQMPDLIDTSGPEDYNITEDITTTQNDEPILNPNPTTRPIIDDLFSDGLSTGPSPSENKHDDDPFADVSFHTNENKQNNADIFSGLSVDQPELNMVNLRENRNGTELFDIFGSNSGIPQELVKNNLNVNDVMASLSINDGSSTTSQNSNSSVSFTENVFNGIHGSQPTVVNGNTMFPLGPMAYNMPPGFMFNPAFASQQLNYGNMSSILAQQQQLLTTMSNFQQVGNLQSQGSGSNISAGNIGGLSSSPLPDIFNPALPNQTPTTLMNSSKKEDTKAFDFISDHLAAARDPKRVV